MGKYPAIILTSQEVIHEALVKKADVFSYRPDFLYILQQISMEGNEIRGVVMRNGETWKNMRRFSLTSMRDLGVGKRTVEEAIRQEAGILCQELATVRYLNIMEKCLK